MKKTKRLVQYLSLLIIFFMLGTVVFPIAEVYAKTYNLVTDENYNYELIEEGTILKVGDTIHIPTNVHVELYQYAYGYDGEYDGTGASSTTFSMSGEFAQMGSCANNNDVWEIKKIISSIDETSGKELIESVHIQEVDGVEVSELEDVTVLRGENAVFSVEATTCLDEDLQYQWYLNDGLGYIAGATESTLTVTPDDLYYVEGAKFRCKVRTTDYFINYDTEFATLSISDGYNIIYKSNDGTETIKTDAKKYVENSQVALDFTNVPTKENCEFAGWATTANSKVATYKTVADKLVMPAENTTLYAVWNVKKLEDTPTKTTLEGTFDLGSTLTITKIEATEEVYATLKVKVEGTQEVIGAFEVKVTGAYSGNIQVTFTVDEKYNGKEMIVYHQKADKTIETIKGTVAEGKLKISVTELSPFMLAMEKTTTTAAIENTANTVTNETSNTAINETTNTNVQTSDNIVFFIAIIAIVAIANYIGKKK